MNDSLLEMLGNYFVNKKLHKRQGWTFEQFVNEYNLGYVEVKHHRHI